MRKDGLGYDSLLVDRLGPCGRLHFPEAREDASALSGVGYKLYIWLVGLYAGFGIEDVMAGPGVNLW